MLPTRVKVPAGSLRPWRAGEKSMCHTSWWHRHRSGHSSHGFHGGQEAAEWGEQFMGRGHDEGGFGGGFGVRRALRVLAYKLGLDEKQVADMARILDELK